MRSLYNKNSILYILPCIIYIFMLQSAGILVKTYDSLGSCGEKDYPFNNCVDKLFCLIIAMKYLLVISHCRL